MKKFSILGVCVLMGATAFGQAQVVKDAEAALKKGATYEEVVKAITPALSNPETSNQVLTFYIPGKAGFATYDKLLAQETLGQLPADGKKTRAEALLGGYEYFQKALPLDSLPDAKGKVKPKYSKEMINTIAGHHADFSNAGVDMFYAEDWDGAYNAWDIYCKIATDPKYSKVLTFVPADTTVAELMYNRSLAAFQSGDMQKTLNSFVDAKNHGYNKKALYDYAVYAAEQLGDYGSVVALAEEALPLYGAEDSRYIRQIINSYIKTEDYAQAVKTIDKAIANEPNNSQYYVVKGIIDEQPNVGGDYMADFAKAVELDPKSSEANYHYGRVLYIKALKANDEAPTDPQEYTKFYYEQFKPAILDAAKYLEEAWNLDNDNRDVLNILQELYYNAKDEQNIKYTEDRLKY